MKTRTGNASNANDSPAIPAPSADRGRRPTLLTERELEMVAAAGGRGGLNPPGRPPVAPMPN